MREGALQETLPAGSLIFRIGCGEHETERSPELQPVDKVGLEPADP
jgi:hypothetical protein